MTSAPGRSMVSMRPPSLEPSTPEVREPRAMLRSTRLGRRGPSFQRVQDRLDRRLVAEAAGVEDDVVVAWQVPGVAVDLPDVRAAVLVHLLRLLPCFFLADAVPLHHLLHAVGLACPEEDVE